MGVLPAVFPEAGAAGPDIAGVAPLVGKGRVEELCEAVRLVPQPVEAGAQGRAHAGAVRAGAEGRPALGDGVDGAGRGARRAERRAVAPPAPEIPGAVPGVLRRLREAGSGLAQGLCALPAQALEKRRKAPGGAREEPGEPYALAADLVHAVVPVAGAGKHKAVGPRAPYHRSLQRPAGVLEDRVRLPGGLRREIAVRLVVPQGRGSEPGGRLTAEVRVAGLLHILAQRPGQPQQIVRAAGTHPSGRAVRRFVPPVEHVAFFKLPRAAGEDVAFRPAGVDEQDVHRVLELVPEAVGPAALVEARAAHEAAGQRLIGGPAVHEAVQRRVGRLYPHPAQGRAPEVTDTDELLPRALRVGKLAQDGLVLAAADQHGPPAALPQRSEAGRGVRAGFAVKAAQKPGRAAAGEAGELFARKRPEGNARPRGAGIFRGEAAVFRRCQGEADVLRVRRHGEGQPPADIRPLAAVDEQHPGLQVPGDEGGDGGALRLPAGPAEAVDDPACPRAVGKQAAPPGGVDELQGLAAGGRDGVVFPRAQGKLPGVLQP